MNRKKLSNKIVYLNPVACSILVAVFFMFVFLIAIMHTKTEQYKQNQISLMQDSMRVLADNQKKQFEQYIANKVAVLQSLVTFPEIYDMKAEKQYDFLVNRSQNFGFHHLFIMQADGIGYYIDENVYRNQKDEPFFYDVMNHDIYITEPFYGADATTLTISVSIKNENNKKVGALCGAVELKEVQQMFQNNKMFLNGSNYLINRKGYYVSAYDMQKVYNKVTIYGESYTDAEIIKKAFEQQNDQNGTMIHNGIEYQTNVTYLKDFDWVIVQCVKTEDILEDLVYIDIWQYASLGVVVIIILCVMRIIFYWHKSNRKINIDTLTGCSSRAAMQNLLERLNSSKGYDISIIYMDLNKFKSINDKYGHDYGDKILCLFSDVLTDIFHTKGCVGRIGGDEFMIVLLDTEEEEIVKMCQAVNERLKEKSKELNLDFRVSAAYGYASRKSDGKENLKDIVNLADERMYKYKENR